MKQNGRERERAMIKESRIMKEKRKKEEEMDGVIIMRRFLYSNNLVT